MMHALIPAALTLLLTTGCSSGKEPVFLGSFTEAVGGNVTFMTKISSVEEIKTINWLFTNGTGSEKKIFDSENFTEPEYKDRIFVDNSSGSLELRHLMLTDTGNYTVELSTNVSAHTQEATLNVYERIAEATITGPTDGLIAGNSSAELKCQAAEGTLISREWLKDGHPLPLIDRITLSSDNSSMTIAPLRSTDSGLYQCRLTNPVSTDTANHTLIVNFGPENVSIIGEGTAKVNSKVEFTCSAESRPPANFHWLLNGTEMESKASFIIEETTLTDTGTYTCVASNEVTGRNSSAVHSFTVTGLDLPLVPESSESLSGGAIAGIVIGTVAGAGLIGGGGFYAYKKWYN